MAHFEKTGKKGHGCCGGILGLFLAFSAILLVLSFTTDMLDSVKYSIMGRFYKQEYSEYVTEYADKYDVDEALVYAVIRTESGFREDVKSSAGAVGLMQIMPDTFKWLQEKESGSVKYGADKLTDPEINIRYGTYYLSYLLSHYNGNEELAIAAYNAGMTNVDKWLKDERYSEDGESLKKIPYKETAKYVKRVTKTKGVYETLYYKK